MSMSTDGFQICLEELRKLSQTQLDGVLLDTGLEWNGVLCSCYQSELLRYRFGLES